MSFRDGSLRRTLRPTLDQGPVPDRRNRRLFRNSLCIAEEDKAEQAGSKVFWYEPGSARGLLRDR